jgi:hypothetical protein
MIKHELKQLIVLLIIPIFFFESTGAELICQLSSANCKLNTLRPMAATLSERISNQRGSIDGDTIAYVMADKDAAQRKAENKALFSVIQEIAQLLASVNGKTVQRKYVTPMIIQNLSYINRDERPVFTRSQTEKIGRLQRLGKRLSLLQYLVVYKKAIQGKQMFMFQGTHIVKILRSSRSEDEIRKLIGMLKGLGITESSPVAMILQSSRSEDEIRKLIGMLKGLGITESSPVAMILQTSRSEGDIRKVIEALKGLGITRSILTAMILRTSRSEDGIRRAIEALKELGITESRLVAMILYSSRSEDDIRKVIGMLKGLGITENSPVAMILYSARSEGEIRKVIGMLKGLGITESRLVAMILYSSRSEREIRKVIGMLRGFGITESSSATVILQSSRSEREIRKVIGMLKGLGITESNPVAMILRTSRSEDEIRQLIEVLNGLGIIKSISAAMILQSARSEDEIRKLIGMLKGLGITESSPVAMILYSARSEGEIRKVIRILKGLGITESRPVAMILRTSRSEDEIRKLIGALRGLGITESRPAAMILQSARSEDEIRKLIGALRSLGITESSPVAMILQTSRSEDEIRKLIRVLKGLGITESRPVAMILRTSRSEDEIRKLIGVLSGLGLTESRPVAMILRTSRSEDEIRKAIAVLRGLGITENSPAAMILQGSQPLKDFNELNEYKNRMEGKCYPKDFIQYVLLRLLLSKSPERLFDMIIAFDFDIANLQIEQMPVNISRAEFENVFGNMGIWLLKFLGKDFRSLRAVIRGYAKDLLLLDVFPESIDLDKILPSKKTGVDSGQLWQFLEPFIASLTTDEQDIIDAFLEGVTADEIRVEYMDISFQEILNKLRRLIEDAPGYKDILDFFNVDVHMGFDRARIPLDVPEKSGYPISVLDRGKQGASIKHYSGFLKTSSSGREDMRESAPVLDDIKQVSRGITRHLFRFNQNQNTHASINSAA